MDPRLTADLRRLSTADLVFCTIIVGRELRAARADRDQEAMDELMDRWGAIDRELAKRQLTIDDLDITPPD